MKKILSLAATALAAISMNAGILEAETISLDMPISYFEDNTGITETAWTKKNIKFVAYTADKSYKAYVQINTDHIAGEYTKDDCSSYGLYITDRSSYTSYYASEASLVVTQEGDVTSLAVDMTAIENQQTYEFSFTIDFVKPEQIEASFGNISLYDYAKPTYSISGESSLFTVNMNITSAAENGVLVDGEYEIGTYSNLYDKTFDASIYFAEGSKVTVTNTTSWNGDPCVNITGEVMGKNGLKYALSLTSGLPDPDNMLQLADTEAAITCDFRENGRWSIEGHDENISVHMQMVGEDYEGVYDMKKWNFGYNNYMTIDGVKMDLTDAHIVVTDLGDDINATGWVLASHAGQLYYVTVDLTGVKGSEPAANGDSQNAVNVAFNTYSLSSDWMWGGWILNANNDEGYHLHLVSTLYWESGDLPTGTYTVSNDWEVEYRIMPSTELGAASDDDDDWNPLSLTADGRVPNGSYVADAEGHFWFIYKGTVTVAYDEDGLNVECDCINTAGQQVKVVVGANATTGISNASVENAAGKNNGIRLINGKIMIENNGHTYNLQGSAVK